MRNMNLVTSKMKCLDIMQKMLINGVEYTTHIQIFSGVLLHHQSMELRHTSEYMRRLDLLNVQIVDMREAVNTSRIPDFSLKMVNSIQKKLDKKEQIVLLLNRRGYSTFMMCRECGYVIKCPNCDISLTVYLDSRSLKCHY